MSFTVALFAIVLVFAALFRRLVAIRGVPPCGGYDQAHDSGPKPGFQDVGVLIGAAGAVELMLVRRRRRRARRAAKVGRGQRPGGRL